MATTRIQDVVVPEIFNPYVQQQTEEKSNLIRSGAMAIDPSISALLTGGGLTFNTPSWKDLENSQENVSNDDPAQLSSPNKIGSATEISVRLNRNNSWSTMDLSGQLAGSDPMMAIANRVSEYWTRRLQAAFVATVRGLFAMNAAAPAGGSTHTQNDMTFNAAGTAFVDGVTTFNAENFIDATQTMGDSKEKLSLIMVHSVVESRMKKNNLIDYVSDSVNGNAVRVPVFLNHRVVVDDGMPYDPATGIFESWIFANAAIRLGTAPAPVPTEFDRIAAAGNGAGQDILHNRVQWCLHPQGHAYVGVPPAGGPSNAATANNLAAAASWARVFTERKQIGIARLLTRELNV